MIITVNKFGKNIAIMTKNNIGKVGEMSLRLYYQDKKYIIIVLNGKNQQGKTLKEKLIPIDFIILIAQISVFPFEYINQEI